MVSSLVGGIPPGVDQLVRAATSRDPQQRPTNAGVFLRVTRALRGMPEPADSVTGAWTVSAAAGASPYADGNPYGGADTANGADGLAPTGAGGSHTMVVDARYAGYGETAAGYDDGNAPGRRGSAFAGLLRGGDDVGAHGGGAQRDAGEREPFLQRWLFSSRLVYVLVGGLVLIGLAGGGWWLTSGRYTSVPAVGKLTAAAATQTLHAGRLPGADRAAGDRRQRAEGRGDQHVAVRTGAARRDDRADDLAGTADDHRAADSRDRHRGAGQGGAARGRADRGLRHQAGRACRATRRSARWQAPRRRRAPPGRRTSRFS